MLSLGCHIRYSVKFELNVLKLNHKYKSHANFSDKRWALFVALELRVTVELGPVVQN